MSEGNERRDEEQREARRNGGAEAPADAAQAAGGDGAQEQAASVEELLETLRAERDELKERLLRVAADFDNFRKRTRKDLEEAERRGREAVLREVLPVIDNLERAVQSAAQAKSVEAVSKGVEMVLRLFEEAASRIGLQRVASVGERFDPNVHDAVQQQESEEHAPGTVVGELVPGYKLGERLLRAAMVVVARPPTTQNAPEAAERDAAGEADGGRAGSSSETGADASDAGEGPDAS